MIRALKDQINNLYIYRRSYFWGGHFFKMIFIFLT
jgi:hypothetical protein